MLEPSAAVVIITFDMFYKIRDKFTKPSEFLTGFL